MGFFIANLMVPIIIYFQLLAQNLFPIILAIIEVFNGDDRKLDLKPDWSQFSYSYTCLIIFVILFVLTMRKDISLFIKINSYGVIFITIIVVFILGMGFYGFSNTVYAYSESSY